MRLIRTLLVVLFMAVLPDTTLMVAEVAAVTLEAEEGDTLRLTQWVVAVAALALHTLV
jgi:hypothetical protein